MKEEIKQLQEKAREELEKELDKHLYTCADYEISSDKIDNEILKTTGESIKKEILERQNTLIEQTYKQGMEDKDKEISELLMKDGLTYEELKYKLNNKYIKEDY
jgi:hypothetical protein